MRQSRVKPTVSYAQAAQQAPPPPGAGTPDPTKAMTGLMCLFHAHLANVASPGCFQQMLSASLADNGLQDVRLPPPPPLQAPEALARAFSLVTGHTPSASASTADTQDTPPDTAATASTSASDASEDDAESVASSASEEDTEGDAVLRNPQKPSLRLRRQVGDQEAEASHHPSRPQPVAKKRDTGILQQRAVKLFLTTSRTN